MPTNLTTGLLFDTTGGMGGVDHIWILGSSGASAGFISGFGPYVTPPIYGNPSLGATGLTAMTGFGTWYHVSVNREVSNYEDIFDRSQENQTIKVGGKLTTQLYHISTAKAQFIQQLQGNNYLKIVYRDSNNIDWCFGFDKGAYLMPVTATTGTKYGDFNGYKLIFQATGFNPVYQLNSDFTTIAAAGGFTVQPISNS